jgi:hypothetical protein
MPTASQQLKKEKSRKAGVVSSTDPLVFHALVNERNRREKKNGHRITSSSLNFRLHPRLRPE